MERLSEMCKLGPHGDLIIPPSWIVKLPRKVRSLTSSSHLSHIPAILLCLLIAFYDLIFCNALTSFLSFYSISCDFLPDLL